MRAREGSGEPGPEIASASGLGLFVAYPMFLKVSGLYPGQYARAAYRRWVIDDSLGWRHNARGLGTEEGRREDVGISAHHRHRKGVVLRV
jgi:hypothetical protein